MKSEFSFAHPEIPVPMSAFNRNIVDSTQLQYLLEFSKRALAELDVDRAVTLALDHFIDISGSERGMIILFNECGEILYETARKLNREIIEHLQKEISQTIIRNVQKEGQPIDRQIDFECVAPKNEKSASELKILSMICIPLTHNGKNFGVVCLDNRTTPGSFKSESLQFIKNFAYFILRAAYHALQKKQLMNHLTTSEMALRTNYDFEAIVGHSSKMIEVLQVISQVVDADVPVLIEGETGTGKELVARAIHFNSNRSEMPLVCVNCGAFPENLLESEFFGHEKGAFTGAFKRYKGKFEQADGGSIFLDEIDEMPPALQVKLLRILQWGEFSPLGSEETKQCNVRIVAASKRKLQKLVEEGNFRDDLYYRLNLVRLELPPLRTRREDILLLTDYFVKKACQEMHKSMMVLTPEAQRVIQSYHYPGNVRELENIIRRAVILCMGEKVEIKHLPPELRPLHSHVTYGNEQAFFDSFKEAKKQVIEDFERYYLRRILNECNGVIRKAARRARMHEKNFHAKLRKYGIHTNNR